MSKNQFKILLRERIKVVAFEYLINIKNTQSKIKSIQYSTLKIQKYLISSELDSDSASFIFLCRSKMLDLKANYKGNYKSSNMHCQGCLNNNVV